MRLYINIFKDLDFSQIQKLKINSDDHLLDLQSNQINNQLKSITVEEFDHYELSYNSAVSKYTSFVSELSTKSINGQHIRSLKLNDLPLFWLTSISIKHYDHWVMKTMLFRELLTNNRNFFNSYDRINILIPEQYKGAETTLSNLFGSFKVPVNFEVNNIKNQRSSILKIGLRTILSFIKIKSPELTTKSNYTGFLLRGKLTNYTKNLFDNLMKISHADQEEIVILPLYPWLNPKLILDYKVPHVFWKAKPTIFTLTKTFFEQLNMLKKIRTLREGQLFNIDDLSFPSSLLVKEFEDVIYQKNESLIMNIWLQNYNTKENNQVKLFYENEFYHGGRTISFGLNKMKSYSIQHSMIVKNHSVYHISNKEIDDHNKLKGLPLPYRFIVWGDFFKKQFLSNNSLNEDFIISAGNPTYINQYKEKKESISNSPIQQVLYCLTTPEIFSREKSIILDSLHKFNNIKLVVRFHPLWNFDKKLVLDFFKGIEVSFNQDKDIFNVIRSTDLILTSSQSGVWLDALILETPVIRLVTSFYDNIEQSNMVFNVSNTNEMNSALESFHEGNKKQWENNLLYLKSDKWENLMGTDKKC